MSNFFLLIHGSPPPLSGLVAGAAERGAQGWYWQGGEVPCGGSASVAKLSETLGSRWGFWWLEEML